MVTLTEAQVAALRRIKPEANEAARVVEECTVDNIVATVLSVHTTGVKVVRFVTLTADGKPVLGKAERYARPKSWTATQTAEWVERHRMRGSVVLLDPTRTVRS